MYEYNSAITTTVATNIANSDNSTSMMNDFVMGFQQYEDEEDEEQEFEGEFMTFYECTLVLSVWVDICTPCMFTK